ncbi:MAG: hypothetical protein Q9214_007402, partial [Letrouitia sp. 1 TL-2023]
ARRKKKAKAADARNSEPGSLHAPDAEEENLSLDQSDHEEHKQDLGFDDPFFAAPSTSEKKKTKSQRREAKRLERAALEAKEVATAAERAELELLMMDDDKLTHTTQPNNGNSGDNQRLHHFNMSTLAKAEKALAHPKQGKKRKTSAREKEALEAKAKDEFQINVQDTRFSAVFESAEYAIDPSHPRYLGTEGMRELLQEGRKKRRRREEGDDDDGDRGENEGRKTLHRGRGGYRKDKEVQRLVEKLKGSVRK